MSAADSRPRFSVIIPTLNEEKYLEPCLRALRSQKGGKRCEILLGDSYSTDGTAKIAKKYGCRIVLEKRRTPSAGRHAAARQARGELLAFTNADVVPENGWLESITAPFEDRKVVGVLGSIRTLDGSALDNAGTVLLSAVAHLLNAIGMDYAYGENMAVRASAYKKCGGFDGKLVTGEEVDLIKRLRRFGKFTYAREATVRLSMRRVRKWGYAKYLAFHTSNFFRSHLSRHTLTGYEPVR